jgi:hypothetical protein
VPANPPPREPPASHSEVAVGLEAARRRLAGVARGEAAEAETTSGDGAAELVAQIGRLGSAPLAAREAAAAGVLDVAGRAATAAAQLQHAATLAAAAAAAPGDEFMGRQLLRYIATALK